VERGQPGWAPKVGARPAPSSSYKYPPSTSIFFTQTFQKPHKFQFPEGALVVKREESREEEKSGKEVGSF